MPYDATLFSGSAEYYARGRPPYSLELASAFASELSLDGSGRLLDVGCGPGTLTLLLNHLFEEAIGLDPDAKMLEHAARRAEHHLPKNVRWIRAVAEDIAALELGTFKLVTFGQSFHWTDRERVAEAVYDLLEPEGAVALVVHAHEGRERPAGPGYPVVPLDAVNDLLRSYLGPKRRAGQGFWCAHADGFEETLSRSRFGKPRTVYLPGVPDHVVDAETILAGIFSTSYGAPHLFGARLTEFERDVRNMLAEHSASGLFWEWPGDTEILIARK